MRFDEGGGATAYDEGWTDTNSDGIKDAGESWNNLDGTLTPGASGSNTAAGQMWSRQGKIGGALECDGTDDYVSVGDNSTLDLTTDISIALWVKLSANNYNDGLVYKGSLSDSQGVYSLGFYSGSSNALTFRLNGSTTEDNGQISSTNSLSTGTWYHAVATYDGTTMKIYENGVLVKEDAQSLTITTDNNNLIIGGYYSSSYLFNGLIDDVRIYNYARTPLQILEDYNAGAAARLGD